MSIEIDCRSVHSKLDTSDDFLLLDCREQNEWDHVHIEGATLIPMSEIQNRVGELDEHRDREIVVYCHHGGRSLQVAMWLAQRLAIPCWAMGRCSMVHITSTRHVITLGNVEGANFSIWTRKACVTL